MELSEEVNPSVDTTFDGIVPESVWLNYDNQIHGKDRFCITLEVNKTEKKIMDFYIPGLSQDEGHHCGGHNLTWLIKRARDAGYQQALKDVVDGKTSHWCDCSECLKAKDMLPKS